MKLVRSALSVLLAVMTATPSAAQTDLNGRFQLRDIYVRPGTVAWGSDHACIGPYLNSLSEPPRNRVPNPYYFETGWIHHGSESCKLIDIEPLDLRTRQGEYLANCTSGPNPDWARQYTIRITLDGDQLSMIWKSTAYKDTYRVRIVPMSRCSLKAGEGKLPWEAD
ncbi:hypothetical protein ACKTEK_10655 [Tepidamorphus sp. 3E244]|uniref:hypothetical protein n=1 Tax=Tepidamorphus sp. 3E244 TaxID=3385498 RepID=UPI0038FCCED1